LSTLHFRRTEFGPEATVRVGPPTDQMLTRAVPGRQEARIFPLRHDSDAVEVARTLVARERPGPVTFSIADRLAFGNHQASIIRAQLERIGLDVDIKLFPPVTACPRTPPSDLTLVEWTGHYADSATLFTYLDGPPPGCDTALRPLLAKPWSRRFQAANRLRGKARLRALGRLEVRMLRDHIPVTAVHEVDAIDVFSDRLGCTERRGVHGVDAGALCLRR
jgi:hypothetical protein